MRPGISIEVIAASKAVVEAVKAAQADYREHRRQAQLDADAQAALEHRIFAARGSANPRLHPELGTSYAADEGQLRLFTFWNAGNEARENKALERLVVALRDLGGWIAELAEPELEKEFRQQQYHLGVTPSTALADADAALRAAEVVLGRVVPDCPPSRHPLSPGQRELLLGRAIPAPA